MFERERATGECECGAIIYGPGVRCDACHRLWIERRLDRLEERVDFLYPNAGEEE